MGFRAGAEAIFGKGAVRAEEEDLLTEQGAANFGSLIRQLQKDKADVAAQERASSEANLKGISDIINNMTNLSSGLRKSALVPLMKRLQAEGINASPEFWQGLIGDDNTLQSLALKLQEYVNATDPAERERLLQEIAPFLDSTNNPEKASKLLIDLVGGGAADRIKQAEFEQKLRKEFFSATENIRKLDEPFAGLFKAYNRIVTKGRTPAAMQALVTFFNKMTDPGSVVRESEFNRFFDFASARQRAQNIKDSLKMGVPVQQEQLDDLYDTARQLAAPIYGEYQRKRGFFEEQSLQSGGRPGAVGGLPTLRLGTLPASSLELQNRSRQERGEKGLPDPALKPIGDSVTIQDPKGGGPIAGGTDKLIPEDQAKGSALNAIKSGKASTAEFEGVWEEMTGKPMSDKVRKELKDAEDAASGANQGLFKGLFK